MHIRWLTVYVSNVYVEISQKGKVLAKAFQPNSLILQTSLASPHTLPCLLLSYRRNISSHHPNHLM